VRPWFTSLALALLLIPSPCRADVFDETDGKDAKKADPKHGEDDARREQQLWEAYVKKLGDGPIYRVEVLYRGGPGADHLTYCRHHVSAAIPTPHGLFGFGVNAQGEVVPPADPGHEPVKAALEVRKVGKNDEPPPPPLATRTRYAGITLAGKDTRPGTADIHVGDRGDWITLPKKASEPEFRFIGSTLFRLEVVTAEDVLKTGPLRQDAWFFRARIGGLRREVLEALHLTFFPQNRHNLVKAAYLFRHPDLLAAVRKVFDDWIAKPPLDFDGTVGPRYLADCLADLGDEQDFAAFHQMAKRHPEDAKNLIWATLTLVERVGAAKALPLVEDLLSDATPHHADGRIEVLRELDPTIPELTEGDRFLEEAVRQFRLKATCYELRPVQQTLDALQKTRPLTPEQQLKLATCHESEYVFLTKAARRQGVELVLDWFKQYQPPANK
jgi:hypothetical protein